MKKNGTEGEGRTIPKTGHDVEAGSNLETALVLSMIYIAVGGLDGWCVLPYDLEKTGGCHGVRPIG